MEVLFELVRGFNVSGLSNVFGDVIRIFGIGLILLTIKEFIE